MTNIQQETRDIMRRYNIKANKSLGQNFLISQEVINKIVESSEIDKNDLVIEIGPGLGTLTKQLLERAGKVICVEIDEKMVNILKNRFFQYENFELINKDILKIDLKELIEKEKLMGEIKNVKIVANLPYYITTPIIMKLLEEELDIQTITVMIQKEVADRIIATPGEKYTGAITYTVYYYADSQDILEVSNDCFIPSPEVTSKVIKLEIRKQPPVELVDKQIMFKIIKSAFMQKRKTLLNSLVNSKIFNSKQEGIQILEENNIDLNIRAEKLQIQDFANIANKLSVGS